MNVNNLMCNVEATIEDVMQCINKNAKGIAFILDNNSKLMGVLSDGDIRRLLLDGYGLKARVKEHLNSNFAYAHDPVDAQYILNRDGWKYKIIPIVDNEMHVIDYVEYNGLPEIG